MNFYEEIAHKLYLQKTIIGDTRLDWKEYIEAMQEMAAFKGKPYYSNIVAAMPNHFGAALYPQIFKEVLAYCKRKIELNSKPDANVKIPTEIETRLTNAAPEPVASPDDALKLLNQNFVGLYLDMEKKAKPMEMTEIIKLAALLQSVWERKWFIETKNRVKTLNNFSETRYGKSIKDQLGPHKKDMEPHIEMLKKHF